MKHRPFIFSVVAVCFGVSLVAVSLASAAQDYTTTPVKHQKELYFNSTMLPDHALYPMAMMRDRVILEAAQPDERIELRVQYARQRIAAAAALLDKGKPALALSTATKAQKYLLTAALEAQQLELDAADSQAVRAVLQQETASLEALVPQFPESDRGVLQKLISESQAAFQ